MSVAILTASRLGAARACQRLHHYRYELGYRPLEDAHALRFGQLVHRGLEAWWTAEAGERLEAAHALLRGEEADPFERVRAEELLRGYDVRWGGEAYELLAAEVPFEAALRNPLTGHVSRTWRLAGKVDAVVRDVRDGRVLLVEHKTSSEDISPGSLYWRRLRLDGQVSVYYEGAAALGYDVQGCIYDVLGKPQLRPYKPSKQRPAAETPEEFRARVNEELASNPLRYYERAEVVRLESEMTEALWDVWQLAQQIREAQLAERAPRNPDACMRWGRVCPYFDVCTGAADLTDESRFARSDNVHPELQLDSSPVPTPEVPHGQ